MRDKNNIILSDLIPTIEGRLPQKENYKGEIAKILEVRKRKFPEKKSNEQTNNK
ncbi:MAG: hypothetical protein NTY80_00410 [candidate division SR1 bacterium]|nr:hypothetical protein [candidate division SR1 bacterium]